VILLINSSELFFLKTVKFFVPFSNNLLQFMTITDWDGEGLKMDVSTLKGLLDNYMGLSVSEQVQEKRKHMKKIGEINEKLAHFSENGLVFLFLERFDKGLAYIGQTNSLSRIEEQWDFQDDKWKKFTIFLGFTYQDKGFGLSDRTTIEAKLLNNVNTTQYTLLNQAEVTQEKIKLAEYQLKEPYVTRFLRYIKVILRTLGIELFE
jgi:hypothetical protein